MLTTLFHSVIYGGSKTTGIPVQPSKSFHATLSERIPHKFFDHLRGLNFGWQCWLTNYVEGFWSKDTWAWIWIWFISIKACEVASHDISAECDCVMWSESAEQLFAPILFPSGIRLKYELKKARNSDIYKSNDLILVCELLTFQTSSNAPNNIYPMITFNDNNFEAANLKSNRRRGTLRKQCPDHQGHLMLTTTINTRTYSFQVPVWAQLQSKDPVLTVDMWTLTKWWKVVSKHGS